MPQKFELIKNKLITQIDCIYLNNLSFNTITQVKRLLAHPYHEYDEHDHYVLASLLKKIDISKRVYVQYDNKWKNPVNKKLVACPVLLSLALIFLQCALTKSQHHEHERGYFFKYLNTAFNCLHLVKTEPWQIKQLLDNFCQKILSEAL